MMLIEFLKTRYEQVSNESVDELILHDARSSAKNISIIFYCQDIFCCIELKRLSKLIFDDFVYSN